uniref:PaRXLR10 n=1 Tax=Phytophthora agathidicida TaxID=1642459 RepID=A0A7G4WHZ9_9STRA|nr:PaRXLR10 [Phytophthora agathidicida]
MRVLSLMALIALVSSCTAAISDLDKTGVAALNSEIATLSRALAADHTQVKRSLRRYDFNELDDVDPEGEERQGGQVYQKVDEITEKVIQAGRGDDALTSLLRNDKVDDAAKAMLQKGDGAAKLLLQKDKLDDVAAKFLTKQEIDTKVNKVLRKQLLLKNIPEEKLEGMITTIRATINNKYPKELSYPTLKQIAKVEVQRVDDIAVYSKKTGTSMRRSMPQEGILVAPEKFMAAHVGRDMQRYESFKDGSKYRLLSASVISRDTKQGGGDVLLISSSNPTKNEWLLPKGGWDKGEDIETAAMREAIEEGGVRILEGWDYYFFVVLELSILTGGSLCCR